MEKAKSTLDRLISTLDYGDEECDLDWLVSVALKKAKEARSYLD